LHTILQPLWQLAEPLAAGEAQAVERLRAGHLVHQVQIDVDQVGFGVAARRHHVVVPNLFRQRARTRSVVG